MKKLSLFVLFIQSISGLAQETCNKGNTGFCYKYDQCIESAEYEVDDVNPYYDVDENLLIYKNQQIQFIYDIINDKDSYLFVSNSNYKEPHIFNKLFSKKRIYDKWVPLSYIKSDNHYCCKDKVYKILDISSYNLDPIYSMISRVEQKHNYSNRVCFTLQSESGDILYLMVSKWKLAHYDIFYLKSIMDSVKSKCVGKKFVSKRACTAYDANTNESINIEKSSVLTCTGAKYTKLNNGKSSKRNKEEILIVCNFKDLNGRNFLVEYTDLLEKKYSLTNKCKYLRFSDFVDYLDYLAYFKYLKQSKIKKTETVSSYEFC